MRPRSILLLSGGLDSVVNTAIAVQKSHPILALTFDYGQRSARREIEAARRVARRYRIPHQVIKLPWLAKITTTGLVNRRRKLPQLQTLELDQKSKTLRSASAVWVPNRNGIFINIAAGFAETLHADLIITGFNAEEAATFPDNSADYVRRVNQSLAWSTLKRPQVFSFTQKLTKRKIVRLAHRIGAPLHLVWSCYEGGHKMCGKCESCLRFKRAFF